MAINYLDMLSGKRQPPTTVDRSAATAPASTFAPRVAINQTYDLNHDPGDVTGNRTKQGIMDLGNAQAGLTGSANADRNQFLTMLNGGGDYLKSLVSQAMPEFNARLNGIRENSIAFRVQ